MIKSIFLKKVVFAIAAFTILLQIVFLLEAKNNSLAQVDETIPIAPSGLMLDGTPTSTSISLKWTDNSTNEDKFNIERKLTTATDWTGAWFTQITTANTIAYTDTSVTAGTTYDYRVQACLSGYGCSEYAYLIGVSSASAISSDTTSPSAPTTLVATKDDYNEVDLKWTASTDNVGVTGYEVWRSTAGVWSNIGQTLLPPYIDTTVSPATPYYYKIIAYDAMGNKSSPSAQLFLNTPAASSTPLPPSSVTASSTVGKIYVSWPASTSTVKYSIYRKVNGGSYQIWYTNITNLYYHDLSVVTGNVYQYKVMGCNATTCSTAGTESNSITYIGDEASCTSLTLTLNDGKTAYVVGDTVNYTWTCSPGGSVSNVSMRLYKPDNTSTLYNSSSGSTQTMGFGTLNLIPGVYNLKACFDSACATVNASKEFTVVSGTTTIPTFTLSPQVSDIAGLPSKKLMKVTVTSNPTGHMPTSITGKVKDSSGNIAGSTFSLAYQTGDYWIYEYDTSGLSGNYTFCASGMYNATLIPLVCNTTVFAVLNTAVPSATIFPTVTTTTDPYKKLKIAVSPVGTSLYNVTGKIRKDGQTGTIVIDGLYPYFSSTENAWIKEYNASSLSIGVNYVFCATAWLDSSGTNRTSETCSPAFTVTSAAVSTVSLDVSFINIPPMPLKGDNKIFIKTSSEPELVNFKVERDGGSYVYLAAAKLDATNFYFLWKTSGYIDGYYTIYAIAKKGTYEKTSLINATVANYSATTAPSATTEPFTLTFTENFQPPLSGDRNITISSNLKMDTCKFNIEGPRYAEFAGTNNGLQCSFLLHTSSFPDGKYLVRAIATNGASMKEIVFDTTFLNQTSATQPSTLSAQPVSPEYFIPQECKDKGYLTPEECQKYMELPFECRSKNILDPVACKTHMYQYGMPPECVSQGVQTPEECQKIIFLNSMPQECKDKGVTTKEECDKIMSVQFMLTPECKSANITSPDACNTYMIEKFSPQECQNAASQDECNYIIRNSYNTFDNLVPKETNQIFNIPQPISANLPPECKAAQISSPDECKKHMMLLSMPFECREANATTGDECEKIMFKKYGPKECIEAGVFDPTECEKFMFKKYAPEDCKQAGIFNPEACKKYMFEKYNGKDDIPKDKFPIECQKVNANTAEECKKVMKTAYMPKECKDQRITDQKECDAYFEKKYMPNDCKEAGASTREECDRVMFKKYAPKECLKAGIEKDDECQKFMFNLYAPKVKCDNMEDWQCKKNLEESHLGDIVSKQTQFNRIKEKSNEMIGKSIKVETLMESKAFENNEMIPLTKKDTSLKIVSTAENMVLNDENTLVQTGPIAFMIDSDGDGLSNDMESLLGTDPDKADTDGDGYNDGDEAKTGYNPFGPGLLARALSPTEKAMIENKTLEHPKTSGEVSERLAVEKIENLSDTNKEEDGYLLSGKSESGNIVTLYIYSDLPLILVVKADEQGNWEYKLDRSLADGEHEIYVVVNDETGKVVNKSKPSSLFVKEAKAVSASEYLKDSVDNLTQETPEDISSNKYNFIVFFSITAALSIFGVMLILRKKKNQSAK